MSSVLLVALNTDTVTSGAIWVQCSPVVCTEDQGVAGRVRQVLSKGGSLVYVVTENSIGVNIRLLCRTLSDLHSSAGWVRNGFVTEAGQEVLADVSVTQGVSGSESTRKASSNESEVGTHGR